MTKTDLYTALADDLAEFWHRDAALLERNPEAWEEGRIIDEWLVTYRDSPKVQEPQYKRNCDRLRDTCHKGPKLTTTQREILAPGATSQEIRPTTTKGEAA